MPPRGLLLDMFGTVVEHGRDVLLDLSRDVTAQVLPRVSPEAFLAAWEERFFRVDGQGFVTIQEANDVTFCETLRAFGVSADPTPWLEAIDRGWRSLRVFPDAPDVLRALADVPTCLVTNADDDLLDEVLRRNRLHFDHIVTSEACRAYKPRPEMFDAALRELGLASGEVLHAGDSQDADLLGARRFGLRVAWVNRRGEPLQAGIPPPDHELPDLRGLPGLLRA